jgi:hypothetical protein
MGYDIDGTVELLGQLVDAIDKLVRLATDPAAALEERRNAAMSACERIASTRVLEKVRALLPWYEANKRTIARALKGADLINDIFGRKR